MNRYFYDLHMHSCLSPCGDNDMTPNNMAGMAALKGLQIAALTDHNSSRNCPAFLRACKANGIVGVPGMELTTSEDIHMLCLFETLDAALAFNDEVDKKRIRIVNKPEIFGEQLVMDENDGIVGREEHLLINATTLSLEEATDAARSFGAFITPAHVDKQANGILAILGDFPAFPVFPTVEFNKAETIETCKKTYPNLANCFAITDSDAHYLWDISEAEHAITLDDEPYSSDRIRHELIETLKSGGNA